MRTSALREITVDPAGNVARVGAGVRGRDLVAALSPHGLAASLGSGPTTGVVGFTMFGGAGVLGRPTGFTAHKVVAADVLELLGLAVTPEADEAIRRNQHAISAALGPWSTGTTLPGFAVPQEDTAERVYPPATRDRLRRVKNYYDPDGVILPSFPLP